MYSAEKPNIKYRKDYQPSQYLIKQTGLRFQLFDDYTYVYAELLIERNPLDNQPELKPLVLNGIEIELLEIFICVANVKKLLRPMMFEANDVVGCLRNDVMMNGMY